MGAVRGVRAFDGGADRADEMTQYVSTKIYDAIRYIERREIDPGKDGPGPYQGLVRETNRDAIRAFVSFEMLEDEKGFHLNTVQPSRLRPGDWLVREVGSSMEQKFTDDEFRAKFSEVGK